jgi:hypothetical protein
MAAISFKPHQHSATTDPRNDLVLLFYLSLYPRKVIADAAVTPFGRNLWYLSKLLASLGFFHNDMSLGEKKLIIAVLVDKEGSEIHKRIAYNNSSPNHSQKRLDRHHFVINSTHDLFCILN